MRYPALRRTALMLVGAPLALGAQNISGVISRGGVPLNAAIVALTQGTPGLTGRTLANQVYADRIGPLLGKAARVQTTSGDSAHIILPGNAPR